MYMFMSEQKCERKKIQIFLLFCSVDEIKSYAKKNCELIKNM